MTLDLKAIRERLEHRYTGNLQYPAGRIIHEDVPALVDEVERLRAELVDATANEIVLAGAIDGLMESNRISGYALDLAKRVLAPSRDGSP